MDDRHRLRYERRRLRRERAMRANVEATHRMVRLRVGADERVARAADREDWAARLLLAAALAGAAWVAYLAWGA